MEVVTEQSIGKTVPKGYKRTELGVIPKDWEIVEITDVTGLITDGAHLSPPTDKYGLPIATVENLKNGSIDLESCRKISKEDFKRLVKGNCKPELGDVLVSKDGTIGISITIEEEKDVVLLSSIALVRPLRDKIVSKYLSKSFSSDWFFKYLNKVKSGSALKRIVLRDLRSYYFPLPPTLEEQHSIAEALSDVDALIAELDAFIEKKQQVKKGAMQQLLTGKKRLPGFDGEWEENTLGDVANCLDNLRVPLNQEERDEMKGSIPYCGANGILDYVNDYVIDDDIILMAEDGGHFDEYDTRPIAYRMTGKCWVNNHAHILQAREDFDQGFLFYSLVHKDITDYITGGTRAKLNKGNMVQIELIAPPIVEEQKAIAQILSDMDAEIQALLAKRSKYEKIKQGMMQELLTGKTRLV